MNKVDFYLRCAEIIGVDHETIIRSPYYRRTRWTNREAGNGRFAGVGLVRFFGGPVHIAINHPITFSGSFDTPEEALACLEDIFGKT